MRILHVLTSPNFSGAENVACQIINLYRNSDVIMAYTSPDGGIREKLAELDIKFYPMSRFSLNEINRVVDEFSPDLIHAHDMRASFMVSLNKKNIPFISHIHNNNFDSRRISFKSLAFLYAGFKAKHIIWVSKSSFEGYKYHKYLKNKSTVLYNVINLKALKKASSEATDNSCYDVIFLGRLTHQKNPFKLISVFKKLTELKQDIKIAIVGTGDLEEDVKNKITENKLNDIVDIKGFMNNPYGLLKNAKVMVLTSLWEGTPMCALESFGVGTPIVSTPVDGLVDIIIPGENGYFGNSDDELAKHIMDIITNDKLRENLSIEAYRHSESINDLVKYKEEISNIYRQ